MASAASTDPKWHTVLCDSESDQGVFKISLLEPLQALKTQARVCRTTRQHVQRLYLLGLLSCNHAKIGLQDSWQYELTTMPSVIRRFWRKAHSSSVNSIVLTLAVCLNVFGTQVKGIRSRAACPMACLQMYPHGTGGTSLYNLRRSQHACRKSFIKRSRRRYANKRCLRCSPYTQAVHRGYLGETRTHMNTRYSSATVDQDKEDHRQNMRTVLDLRLPLEQQLRIVRCKQQLLHGAGV